MQHIEIQIQPWLLPLFYCCVKDVLEKKCQVMSFAESYSLQMFSINKEIETYDYK